MANYNKVGLLSNSLPVVDSLISTVVMPTIVNLGYRPPKVNVAYVNPGTVVCRSINVGSRNELVCASAV